MKKVLDYLVVETVEDDSEGLNKNDFQEQYVTGVTGAGYLSYTTDGFFIRIFLGMCFHNANQPCCQYNYGASVMVPSTLFFRIFN